MSDVVEQMAIPEVAVLVPFTTKQMVFSSTTKGGLEENGVLGSRISRPVLGQETGDYAGL